MRVLGMLDFLDSPCGTTCMKLKCIIMNFDFTVPKGGAILKLKCSRIPIYYLPVLLSFKILGVLHNF